MQWRRWVKPNNGRCDGVVAGESDFLEGATAQQQKERRVVDAGSTTHVQALEAREA